MLKCTVNIIFCTIFRDADDACHDLDGKDLMGGRQVWLLRLNK